MNSFCSLCLKKTPTLLEADSASAERITKETRNTVSCSHWTSLERDSKTYPCQQTKSFVTKTHGRGSPAVRIALQEDPARRWRSPGHLPPRGPSQCMGPCGGPPANSSSWLGTVQRRRHDGTAWLPCPPLHCSGPRHFPPSASTESG